MSFFFSPIPSQFQNYCIYVPILPYYMTFQGGREMDSKQEICEKGAKAQELSENSRDQQDSNRDIQKLSHSQSECSPLKIQEQIFLQSKKSTAALQSQQIHNLNTQVHKNQGLGEQSGTMVKVNHIFSYIQKSSKSQYVVTRIFKKYPPISNQNFTIKKFYLYQSLLKEKISNYINESSLSLVTELYEPKCEVYSEQQQRYYNKVCRMMIHHFLQEDSIFKILTSRRMHKDKKRSHLEMRRMLKSKVTEILRH